MIYCAKVLFIEILYKFIYISDTLMCFVNKIVDINNIPATFGSNDIKNFKQTTTTTTTQTTGNMGKIQRVWVISKNFQFPISLKLFLTDLEQIFL